MILKVLLLSFLFSEASSLKIELLFGDNDNEITTITFFSVIVTEINCNCLVSLDAIPSGHLNGTLSLDADNNYANFTKLQISLEGNYKIYANIQEELIYSEPFSVEKYIPNIIISFFSTPFIFNITNYMYVTILLQEDQELANPTGANITLNGTMQDKYIYIENVDEEFEVPLCFTEVGYFQITVIILETKFFENIEVKGISLKITGEPDFTNSDTGFDFSVEVYDYYGINLQTDENYFIEILLLNDGVHSASGNKLNGNYGELAKNGKAHFKNLKILSSGFFYIKAKCKEYEVFSLSTLINSTNNIQDIVIESVDSYKTVGFPISLSITLIGDDEELYIDESKVNFQVQKGSIYQIINRKKIYMGKKFLNTTSGLIEFNAAFSSIGPNVLNVMVGSKKTKSYDLYFHISNIVIKNCKLPKTIDNTFNCTIKIYNYNQKAIQDFYDDTISVYLIPADELINNKYKIKGVQCINGIAQISNYKIDTPGYYKLVVKLNEMYKIVYLGSIDNYERIFIIGIGPAICICVLVVLFIFSSIILFRLDRHTNTLHTLRFPITIIYPLSSIFIKQPRLRRLLLCSQLFASELTIFSLIGAVYSYKNNYTQYYNKEFVKYDLKEFSVGAAGWAIAQIGIAPLFFSSFYYIGRLKIVFFNIILCIILVFLAFGAIIGMALKYDPGYSNHWTANFLIFAIIDQLVSEVIYTLICYRIMPLSIKIIIKEGRANISNNENITVNQTSQDKNNNDNKKINEIISKYDNKKNWPIEEEKLSDESSIKENEKVDKNNSMNDKGNHIGELLGENINHEDICVESKKNLDELVPRINLESI